jgi:hypothetical protein
MKMIELRLSSLVALGVGALAAAAMIGLGACIVLSGRGICAALDRVA